MKRLSMVVLALLAAAALLGSLAACDPPHAAAQGPTQIVYGDQVSGEISATNASVEYEFEGQAGDVIVFVLDTPRGSDRLDARLDVSTADGTVLRHLDSWGVELRLAIRLPTTETYTVTVRGTEDSTGPFDLVLHHAACLPMSTPTAGNITGDQYAYYCLESAEQISVFYLLSRAGFTPNLSVYTIDEYNPDYANVTNLDLVGGLVLAPGSPGGALIIDGTAGLYVIEINSATLFDLDNPTDDVSASYQIVPSP